MLDPTIKRASRGSATAELSVLLPFLILGVLGTVDFARICYQTIAIANAAHAGAKYGAHSPMHTGDSVGIETATLAELQDTLTAEDVTIQSETFCSCPDGTEVDCETGVCGLTAATRRTYVRVQVDGTFEPLFNYPGIPAIVLLSREAYVRAR